MPRAVIFDVSVCRGRPSLTAAPAGPDTWPRHTVMYPRAAGAIVSGAPHADAPDAPAPSCGGDLQACLPASALCLARRAGLRPPPRPWPSAWRPVAAMPLCRVQGLLVGDPRHALPWHTGGRGAHRVGPGRLG